MQQFNRIGMPVGAAAAATAMILGALAYGQDDSSKNKQEAKQSSAKTENVDKKPKPKEIKKSALTEEWMNAFQWRSIGPANMSGRIVDIAVYEADPSTFWVASASGGLLKTTNNGTTFTHQFDREKTISIGDVEVAQSDSSILYVGTGEANPRNSVSWGNGIYKSVDGGNTWEHKGLDLTFQIGEIKIHPDNPDIVYVGALGRLWGPNKERGLYKTEDGGDTWTKIFYVDDKTGVVDVDMHPNDPDTLIIAAYERQRDGFDTNDPAKKWGAGSGMYKTTDGGKTWAMITDCIPSNTLGRIGIDWYRSDPNVLMAVIEAEGIGEEPENAAHMGIRGEDAEVGARLTEVTADGPADECGLQEGDVVIEFDGAPILSYVGFTNSIREHLAEDTVLITVSRNRKPVVIECTLGRRPGSEEDKEEDGEATSDVAEAERATPFRTRLGGQMENIQKQQGPDGDEKGGIYKSVDGGESWQRINSLNPRPMYYSEIRIDPSDSNHVIVLGTQLFKSNDGGATFTNDGLTGGVHVDNHAMWIDPNNGRHIILGNDGGLYVTHDRMLNWEHYNRFAIGQFYHVGVGPRENYNIYGGLQDNGSWGGPSRTARRNGPRNSDWFRIGGGDGFLCVVDPDDPDQLYAESQNGGLTSFNLATGNSGWLKPRAPRDTSYRFNWRTPFLLSNHNSRIYYVAGNYVFRSLYKGSNAEAISPEITNTDRGSATALAESSLDSDVLFVGTDDGAVWRTKDGGNNWDRLFGVDPEPESDDDKSADSDDGEVAKADDESEAIAESTESKATDDTESAPTEATSERNDPITGEWKATIDTAEIPEGQRGFELVLKLDEENNVTGQTISAMGEGKITDGKWNAENKTIHASIVVEESVEIDLTAKVESNTALTGEIGSSAMGFTFEFSASREAPVEQLASETQPEAVAKSEVAVQTSKRRRKKADKEPVGPTLETLMPGPRWVSSIETSRHKKERVYITFDGHRSDDDMPHVFVSNDYGDSWTSLTANLPDDAGTTRVLREDLKNPNVLYLGTEFSAWVSIDAGTTWASLNTNLPTVAIHEIAQHPTRGEIVAGTHGRSLWILDVTALRQFDGNDLDKATSLYKPNKAFLWHNEPSTSESIRAFTGENPESGSQVFYSIAGRVGQARLIVKDVQGNVLREFDTDISKGLHSVRWDLRKDATGGRRRWSPRVSPGTYLVELTVDGATHTQPLVVTGDPDYPEVNNWGIEYEIMLDTMRRHSAGDDDTNGYDEVDGDQSH